MIVVVGTPAALILTLVVMLVKKAKQMPPGSEARKVYIQAANARIKDFEHATRPRSEDK